MKKVLKLTEGSLVEVFDGRGNAASGSISYLDNKKALVMATPLGEAELKSKHAIAVGALKPGFVDELLPCLTELGMSTIHVFLSDQVEKSRITEKAIQRWHKIILASVKQCKRNHIPEIKTWPKLSQMIAHLEEQYSECLVLDASGTEPFLSHSDALSGNSSCAGVGGEKGFTQEELSMLQARGHRIQKLGDHILRAYTAAIATASLLSTLSLDS